ncbi:MAG: response regulator [Deltaproteobacteria bacterium]|nr:response regulator [Deltaproteobacteria bacterium]
MDSLALGGLLVEAGCLPKVRLDAIIAQEAFVGGDRVAAELYALLAENETPAAETLAERMQAPALVLSASTLDLTALALVPMSLIRQHTFLPVLSDGSSLTVAATTAELPGLIETLEVATGRRIVVVVAIEPLLRAAIDDAVVAWSSGRATLRGARSTSDAPSLSIARAPTRVRMPRADSVARALGALLDAALDEPLPRTSSPSSSSSSAIGALRLKQIARVRGPDDPPSGGVERPVLPPGGGEPRVAPTPEVPARPRCLVVEDDDAIRDLISRVLRHDGFDVEEAADGQLAAEALRRRRPELVVLDAMLPHVHGFEICAAIKRSPHWSAVPVIMVSAVFKGFDSARDIQEVHGADAFLEKPFEINHLRHVAAELLKREKPATTTTPDQVLTGERARALVDHHVTIGDVASASAVVDDWLAADPFSARAWLERGHLDVRREDYVAALRAYELASVYNGKLFVAHVSLAMLFEQLGFARRARATWEKAASVAPEPAVAAQIRAQLEIMKTA